MEKTLIPQENWELEELLYNSRKFTKLGYIVFGIFLLFSGLLALSDPTYPWFFVVLSGVFVILNFIGDVLYRKTSAKASVSRVSKVALVSQSIEIILLLIIVQVAGLLAYWGIMLVLPFIASCYLFHTRRNYPLVIALIFVVGFFVLGTLEHFGILSVRDAYKTGVNLMANSPFFFLSFPVIIGLACYVIFIMDSFLNKLRRSLGELNQKGKELEEAKTVLEVKVKARTRELEEERASLKERVKERTKELQERIDELERFRRLTVGRELEMVSLKREIEKLKGELKNKKSA